MTGRRWALFAASLASAAVACAAYAAGAGREEQGKPVIPPPQPSQAPRAGDVPVLVELFTSEGCSSCPPADATLARLGKTQPVPGAAIVTLSEHVDVWDGLGWADPFGTPEATTRHRLYAARGDGLYTPQAVVDGQAQVVGSRGPRLEQLVREAAQRPHAALAFERASIGGGEVSARVVVPRGENAGATLEHASVARHLRAAGPVGAGGGRVDVSMSLPRDVPAADLTLVAFVQERGARRVLGTAARALPAP